jgi:hypothetical protein
MRFLSPQRRVSSSRLPVTSGNPASSIEQRASSPILSREDTIQELRAIYHLLDQQLYEAAKSKLTRLGQNLQA